MTGRDGGAIFTFGGSWVVVFFRDPRQQPVCPRWIDRHERCSLGAGPVLASANNSGSFCVEFSQIGASGGTGRIKFHRAFERVANFPGESGGREKTGAIGFLPIDASQPEFVQAVVGVEIAGTLALWNSAIPFVDHEIGAAEPG